LLESGDADNSYRADIKINVLLQATLSSSLNKPFAVAPPEQHHLAMSRHALDAWRLIVLLQPQRRRTADHGEDLSVDAANTLTAHFDREFACFPV
jgi:hypothetical protein